MSQDTFRFESLAPERPRQIVTENGAEFFELCERQDIEIESVSVGKTPAEWIVAVRWK